MDKDNQDNLDNKNTETVDEVSLDDIKAQSAAEQSAADSTEGASNGTDKPLIDPNKIVVSDKSYRNLILILVLFFVIALGVGAWLFSKKTDSTSNSTPGTSTNNQQTSASGPVNLVYSLADKDGKKASIYWRGIDSGTPTKALDLPENTYITQYAVRGTQAAVVVEPGTNNKEKLAIWYSSDSGESYKKVYTDKAASVTDAIGAQITSLVFSSDGKSLIYGYLPADGDNIVTQLVLSSDYKTTELFAEKNRGVFLQGYNSTTQQAVYYAGCYNCDGNQFTDLMVRDGKTNTTKTLLKTPTSAMVVVKEDGTELIAAHGTSNPADEPGIERGAQVAPFSLQKVVLSDGKATPLATVSEVVSGIGYSIGGDVYYNSGKKVVRVGATPVTLFEDQKDIINTFYVDKDRVISAAGSYESFSVNSFVVKSQQNVTLLDGTLQTRVFGVTYQ